MHSLWSELPLPRQEPLRGHVKTDVLVIGGGMAGVLCAHELQRAGIRCVVAEADTIGSGTTGNTTAKLTAQHGLIYRKLQNTLGLSAAEAYLRANLDALARMIALCKELDCDYEEQKHHVYSVTNRRLLEEELETLQALGYGATLEETPSLPFPTAGAVSFPNQGQFHPIKFLKAIAKELTIYENTPIRRIRGSDAIADLGTIHAKAIVVATHFPFLNRHGSYFLKLYQQRSYVLALKNVHKPEGMYIAAEENGLSLRSYDDLLLLGGGGHRTGKQGGGWQELEATAREYYPQAQIVRQWAAQDCMSLDGLPYIGRYSLRTPNLYVATGFQKWGMTWSMAAARMLTQQLLGQGEAFEGIFSPSRSMLQPQLAVNLLESSVNLLTPTVPRCPHLGCALKWNKQEHSWDCPCHGSRFSENGKLLNNPATGNLKKKAP